MALIISESDNEKACKHTLYIARLTRHRRGSARMTGAFRVFADASIHVLKRPAEQRVYALRVA